MMLWCFAGVIGCMIVGRVRVRVVVVVVIVFVHWDGGV